MFTATLIAAESLDTGEVSALEDRLAAVALPAGRAVVEEGKAVDLFFTGDPLAARVALERSVDGIDIVVQPSGDRERRLLVADMDSTMITVECIDELADYAGIKPEIAAITERAMRGELPFEAALKERVALLEGLPKRVIDDCLRDRVSVTPGARELVRTIRARGGHAVLVSGGFTRFAEPIAAEIGFDRVVANRLVISDGRLLGRVEEPVVGADAKQATLEGERERLQLSRWQTLAVGDGANDLPMIAAAGLGIAFHAKPAVVTAAGAALHYGDLTAILHAMGIARPHWAD